MRKLHRAGELYRALKHVPMRTIFLRLKREWRWRQLVRYPEKFTSAPLSAVRHKQIIKQLSTPSFLLAANQIRQLTTSTFGYNGKTKELFFRYSGDRVQIGDIENVAWNNPSKIPANDINRCFFMSFAEFGTLLDGAPADNLQFMYQYIRRLTKAARLKEKNLPIPWQALSVARRLVNLLAFLARTIDQEPSLATDERFVYLLEQARQLKKITTYIREDDLGYNHLASEVFAEYLFAYVFGNTNEQKKISSFFLKTITSQLASDGFQLERSATYQAHILGHVKVLTTAQLLPEAQHDRLVNLDKRMTDALAVMTHPDGHIAVFNDAAIGDGPTPNSLGVNNTTANRKDQLSETGYIKLKGGSVCAIFDVGPCGPNDNPGHAHADFLALEISVGKTRLIVDPGVSSYKASPERNWTRSALSHNGPSFALFQPIEFIGPFRIGRRGSAFPLNDTYFANINAPLQASGWQNGYNIFGGSVARWVGVWPGKALVVNDCWLGLPESQAQSVFLIPSIWVIQEQVGSLHLKNSDTGVIILLRALIGTLSIVGPSNYFPFGPKSKETATKVEITPVTSNTTRNASLLISIDPKFEFSQNIEECSKELSNILIKVSAISA